MCARGAEPSRRCPWQFSLWGLLIFVVWLACGEWVWFRRDPFNRLLVRWEDAPTEARNWAWVEYQDRYIEPRTLEVRPTFRAYRYEADWGYAFRFKQSEQSDEMLQIITWRFPRAWWGHFYRPEVWLMIIFGSLWLWRVRGWWRERRRATAVLSPVPPKNCVEGDENGAGAGRRE